MSVCSAEVVLKQDPAVSESELVSLYTSVGWTAYSENPHRLAAAVRNSTYVATAWEGERLIGLVRAVSDDVSIAFLQDLLVRPEHQGRGVGRMLMQAFLERFEHVRQKALLTDEVPAQLRFYEKAGFWNTSHLRKTRLNCFVRYEGVELE
jgi:GNAT superfamily N-acetyltransferase